MKITNGFKKGRFHSHIACTVDGCLDAVCPLGHKCKCSVHKLLGPVLTALCFPVLPNGNRKKSCFNTVALNEKQQDKGCKMCNGSSVPQARYNCSNPLHRHCSNACMALTQCERTVVQNELVVSIYIMVFAPSFILILNLLFSIHTFLLLKQKNLMSKPMPKKAW